MRKKDDNRCCEERDGQLLGPQYPYIAPIRAVVSIYRTSNIKINHSVSYNVIGKEKNYKEYR